MGKKILLVCVVAFVAVLLSSFIVGVHSSNVVRHRRQAAEGDTDEDPFGGPIENERGVPAAPASTSNTPVLASGDNTTNSPTVTNTTLPGDAAEQDGSNTVTVTVVVVILVLAVVIGVGVFIFLRIRKRRMADYEKKTQIQMSSTSNAGVYVDLTSAPGEKEKAAESPETEHLNKEED